MMVNKLVIVAIVAIVAVPILLGYGFNLSTVTETEYLPDDNYTNVAQLLQTGTTENVVHGDIYKLNTDCYTMKGGIRSKTIPVYETVSSTGSSLKLGYSSTYPTGTYSVGTYDTMYIEMDYTRTASDFVSVQIVWNNNGSNTTSTIDDVHKIYWDKFDNSYRIYIVKYTSNTIVTVDNGITFHFVKTGNPGNFHYYQWFNRSSMTDFVNLSGGFHFTGTDSVWRIGMPDSTHSGLMTINLDSITAANYSFSLFAIAHTFTLTKTTTGGVVNWTVTQGSDTRTLYYDPSRSDNTYQFYASLTETDKSDDGRFQNFNDHYEFRYIGGWPTPIGEANVYQTYSWDKTSMDYVDPLTRTLYLNYYGLSSTSQYSPTVRIDDAMFGGVRYTIIDNKEYNPADFKTNPSTTIKNITLYGKTIKFGGHNYPLDSDGNITLGTHKVSVNGIVLDSVPVAGGYDNRINGVVVSTTAQPSTIKFTGYWRIGYVGTTDQSVNTYDHTEWNVGKFAWDGMDQNFLIVGLITTLAVFIGLGIYARKSNSKGVIPLMIICGGAAALFFVML